MRAPELTPHLGWVNTPRPLSLQGDLAGHVVLLEFWTPGRVECRQVVPDLAWFERKYKADPFVVIGVCSPETRGESTPEAIGHEARRRGITHPVVVDDAFRLWRAFQVKRWPAFALIDPKGTVVGQVAGEGNRMLLDRYIARLLADARLDRSLAPARIEIPREADRGAEASSPLRDPSAVLGVAPRVGAPGRLIVSDSGNRRVIVSAWPDEAGNARVELVLGGAAGPLRDGVGADAVFAEPAALEHDPATGRIFVSDARHHAVRAIELKTASVRTIAGTGELGTDPRGGAAGVRQPLRSPRGLAFDRARQRLLIAMAGDHRLWAIDLTTTVTRAIAGSGTPRVADGPAESACFWQPAGLALASDAGRLYIADEAGSAIRELDLATLRVRTLIGRASLPGDSDQVLSDSGDADGPANTARLRRPACLALWATTPMHASGDRVLVADAGNGKIRLVDPGAGTVSTLLGDRERLATPMGIALAAPRLGEAGTPRCFVAETDRHRVLMIDPRSGSAVEVRFEGLASPQPA